MKVKCVQASGCENGKDGYCQAETIELSKKDLWHGMGGDFSGTEFYCQSYKGKISPLKFNEWLDYIRKKNMKHFQKRMNEYVRDAESRSIHGEVWTVMRGASL